MNPQDCDRGNSIAAAFAVQHTAVHRPQHADHLAGGFHIVPRMDEWQIFADVAAATAEQAIREQVAGCKLTREEVRAAALQTIGRSRDVNAGLSREGLL